MRLSGLSIPLLALVLSATPVAAEDSGTIPTTVTVAAPCILVTGAFDLGTAPFSQPEEISPEETDTALGAAQVENCSSVDLTFFGRVSDATSSTSDATWSPTATGKVCMAPNLFAFRVFDSLDSSGPFLDTTDRELFRASGIVDLRGRMSMPCTGSDGAGETMNLTVTITATF